MRHATSAALDRLEPLLKRLRAIPPLREKSRGVFYRGSRAFLHFHEDGEELWADVRLTEDFERFAVAHASDRAKFLKALEAFVKKA